MSNSELDPNSLPLSHLPQGILPRAPTLLQVPPSVDAVPAICFLSKL